MFREINKCRISGSEHLVTVLSLGEQHLTGVFPKSKEEKVTKGPLDLVLCPESGLVQLKQSYSFSEMYGDNYGYRSGLNQSMVNHLQTKVKNLLQSIHTSSGDIVLDIGSNDSTLLRSYPDNLKKIGIDPTGNKFREYYPSNVQLVPDFFTTDNFRKIFPNEQAKIVTSIAMFYDLEDPVQFARDVESILAKDGVWHFEQSYLLTMLRSNSYDTICQEHLEYYTMQSLSYIMDKANLRIIDVDMNDINGGSFAITACKKNASYTVKNALVEWFLEEEERLGLKTVKPYLEFAGRVQQQKEGLLSLLNKLKAEGKKIFGYGASTKGNVLLQYCGISTQYIDYIAEVNKDKFGCFTPGTHIPIISETEAKAMKPDFFLALPWHFRDHILARESEFLAK
ncbi:MAG: methyltransferase domain-containing protein, partial [Chitinophagaceae bacterium]